MTFPVLISICIPAYKNVDYLTRILDSVKAQTFRDFEVVITDDSPDDKVQALCDTYKTSFSLHYSKNAHALGTPENWNEGLRRATGQWIKIMHDDDWFRETTSLQQFADAIANHTGDLIFCAYYNIYLHTGKEEPIVIADSRVKALMKEPAILFARNIIGPPSVILHRNNQQFFYDPKTKWVVDIDFYIRRLSTEKIGYINQPLINVGMSDQQVTMDCVGNRKVQIPENFYLLNKIGIHCLRNILVYDAWWRLMRNLEVRYEKEIREAGYQGPVHQVILSMIHWQSKIPRRLLTTGVFSKFSMFIHYLTHRHKLSQ
ncbi:MAG: glycosyltransferase family 2 protein [Niastella sp.]|nr:glycosyltransferase family 2 protein [Niastella sp.]